MADYLTHAWYMAAWSDEVGEALLRRRLLGEPILLYRLEDGSVTALTDRCPHRFAPLSIGTRQGDDVTCAYHGLTFDAAGPCVRNPFGPTPKGASVRCWPVMEHDGIIWFWPGEPANADSTPLPDFLAPHRPAGTADQRPDADGGDYQFGTDNLMDLSHIEFVHRGSFAGAALSSPARMRCARTATRSIPTGGCQTLPRPRTRSASTRPTCGPTTGWRCAGTPPQRCCSRSARCRRATPRWRGDRPPGPHPHARDRPPPPIISGRRPARAAPPPNKAMHMLRALMAMPSTRKTSRSSRPPTPISTGGFLGAQAGVPRHRCRAAPAPAACCNL